MRVLCADDDESIRALLEVGLGIDPGLEAHVVDSGDEVLSRAAGGGYDAIVLDGIMPGLDGEETCRRLKADPATADVPVFFLTAMTDPAERARLAGVGAAGFFAKPFDPFTLADELRAALEALERRRAEGR